MATNNEHLLYSPLFTLLALC